MGYQSARDMAEQTDLDTAVRWHLTANCFPPIPENMVEPALAAIQAMVDEEFEQEIALPEGVQYQGQTTVEAQTLLTALHLQPFLDHQRATLWGSDEESDTHHE